MAQPYGVRKIDLKVGPRKGETVYAVQPRYYGTISTQEMAAQISQESALTQADVMGVIERAVHYCQTHMALGYKINFSGMGLFYNELITSKTVPSAKMVNARLIKCVRPAFSPEYTIVNRTFRYTLLPEKVALVKVDYQNGVLVEDTTEETAGDTTEDPKEGTEEPDIPEIV